MVSICANERRCEILDAGAVALEGGMRVRLSGEPRGNSDGCALGYVDGVGCNDRWS